MNLRCDVAFVWMERCRAGLAAQWFEWFAKPVDLFCLFLPIGLKAIIDAENEQFAPHKLDKGSDKVYINTVQKFSEISHSPQGFTPVLAKNIGQTVRNSNTALLNILRSSS